MKIPTLLAFTILGIALILGGLFAFYRHSVFPSQKKQIIPEQITLSNITDNQATIIWHTPSEIVGEVAFGTDSNFTQDIKNLKKQEILLAYDDRDIQEKLPKKMHFVTLTDLKPQTKYYFKIKSGDSLYPDESTEFTTGLTLTENKETSQTLNGTILDKNLQPVEDALVTLVAPDFSSLSTYTSASGNFVLPLKNLRSENLRELATIDQNSEGVLTISKDNQESKINVILLTDGKPLPQITLGEDLDLRDYFLLPTNQTATSSAIQEIINFDLNGDGKISLADQSLVNTWVGKKAPTSGKNLESYKKADLNKDGVVDKKDQDLIKEQLNQ